MVFLSAGSVFAADEAGKNFIANKVGVGYQGMVVGSFLNGISVRGWIGERVGLEASGFYGRVDAEIEQGSEKETLMKADLWMVEAKAMYAIIARSNSKFYAGGKIGYGQLGMTDAPGNIDGSSILTPGLFIGSEWSFPGLPEVGFNFDVGYSWLIYDNKVNDDPYVYMDVNLSGVNATFGVHYYF
ncbi:MAG: hypothetical protein CVU72_04315 [Deltaproteobacteria bacterium HGW-Deltaproteobacteria-7]|nr:MAG: hypothetical protein CVU72_04315 [Deltaproteobacteria bacterium HGW-Deltaproteobacteria-7]